MKKTLQNLITQGKAKAVLQKLLAYAEQSKDEDLKEEVLIQAARFEQYQLGKRRGITTAEEQKIGIAQINQALLQLIDQLPEEATLEEEAKQRPWWQWVLAASVIIGILAGLAEITGYSLRDLFGSSMEGGNTVTVLVHGEDGKDQLVLPNRGIVKLVYGDAIIPEQINNEGEATFKQVPERFFQKDARVEIFFQDPQGEPYRALYHDSLYQLKKGEYIALPVKLYGLERIKGIVKDFETGDPIEGVRISVQGEATFSNPFGEYTLEIPQARQQQFQTIRAYHENYESFELQKVAIQTRREIPILMKPKKQ